MSQEYSFTLTVPLHDLVETEPLLRQIQGEYPQVRISRKTDRGGAARFYLSFPFTAARPDLKFQQWFTERQKPSWQLYGPTYGRWGLC